MHERGGDISIKKEACELGHHVIKMGEALDKGLIYCPSKKGAKHDGCFFDPISGKIVKIFQFKMKEIGSNLHPRTLNNWIDKYWHFDELNIGFYVTKDYDRFSGLISKADHLQLALARPLRIVAVDCSPYVTKDMDVEKVKYLINNQVKLSEEVYYVNESLLDNCGNIIECTFL